MGVIWPYGIFVQESIFQILFLAGMFIWGVYLNWYSVAIFNNKILRLFKRKM